MKKSVIVIFDNQKNNKKMDIEVPLNISANELIYGLNKGLGLGINTDDVAECYLCMDNPKALLRGDDELEKFGIHDGSVIKFNR